MRIYDMYGIIDGSLEAAKTAIEQALNVHLVLHESSYIGEYYESGGVSEENLVLRKNNDPFDNEPAELNFAEFPILFYVNDTNQSELYQQKLLSEIETIKLLQRSVIE